MTPQAIWRALRWIVIFGGCFAIASYAVEHTDGLLAGLLVLIGSATVGAGWVKVWPER